MKVPRAVALLLGLCMLVMNACAPKPKTLDFQQRVAIYERAGIQFTHAVLFKPAETVFTNTLGFKLAPLLLLEVTNTNETSVMPAVYFEESRMQLNGRSYDQVTFTWHPPPPGGAKVAAPSVQGIRLTLSAFGSPVVWEVLKDDTGGDLVFVSQSVETAARAAFGPPLAARRSAVEPSLDSAPTAIVARVIDDGPVPMGPIVHLNAGSHNVSTLVCRCMPTQAKRLLETKTYELRPLGDANVRPAFEPSGAPAAARLARLLRLPVL